MSTVLLAIDTATEACSVALSIDGTIHERYEVAGREHSTRLPAMLQDLLAACGVIPSRIDGIVCGAGPGSFAGVRVGVGFVKGLALGLDRPVFAVSSLAMLAQCAVRLHGATQVLAAIDARMQEVYFGAYAESGGVVELIGEETVGPPDAVPLPPPSQRPWMAAGSGWKAYGSVLSQRTASLGLAQVDAEALPHAADGLRIAAGAFAGGRFIDAARLAPQYLRNRVAMTTAEREALRGKT